MKKTLTFLMIITFTHTLALSYGQAGDTYHEGRHDALRNVNVTLLSSVQRLGAID
ncbi:hypothetical protein JXM67_05460 [candidate division WOR-3 bacterium]|nr:hypothetical protein [candidate division WOR-3 bacterium]